MGRPPTAAGTLLGIALREQRGARTQRDVAAGLGLTQATLARMERGTHAPSVETAIALARWLGWSLEAVLEAARTPAPPPVS